MFQLQTQRMNTGHQVLGFITFVLMFILLIMGVVHHISMRAAARRDSHSRAWGSGPVAVIHTWGGRLFWLLLIINCGV